MKTPLATRLRTNARPFVVGAYRLLLRNLWKMDIGEGAEISLTAKLDKTNPRGVHIGAYTAVNFEAVILSHDFVNNTHRDTWIGDRCHIGARAIVMPGVRIGHSSIVAVASVVMRDVPDGCIVAGNPARVIEKGIVTGKWGVMVSRAATEQAKEQRDMAAPAAAGDGGRS